MYYRYDWRPGSLHAYPCDGPSQHAGHRYTDWWTRWQALSDTDLAALRDVDGTRLHLVGYQNDHHTGGNAHLQMQARLPLGMTREAITELRLTVVGWAVLPSGTASAYASIDGSGESEALPSSEATTVVSVTSHTSILNAIDPDTGEIVADCGADAAWATGDVELFVDYMALEVFQPHGVLL